MSYLRSQQASWVRRENGVLGPAADADAGDLFADFRLTCELVLPSDPFTRDVSLTDSVFFPKRPAWHLFGGVRISVGTLYTPSYSPMILS